MKTEFWERVRQHFTKGELVEFLPISMSDLMDLLEYHIDANYEDLVSECCFELEGFELDNED